MPPMPSSLPVTAVADLDLARYAGTWHEIARLPMFFQRKCAGQSIAEYTPQPDETVTVHNRCPGQDGREMSVLGTARRPDPYARGKLQVTFAPRWLRWLPMVWADYWVIALDDDYRWAMVGEPRRKYLWILSRDPRMDVTVLESLKGQATSMGYDLSDLILDEGGSCVRKASSPADGR
ncbi:lipocalin family protein [Luteibacter sp. PPL201]|uniref:Outer membrane lipoprotein Blc n=1 Tax=Luteibacter sahnii TaxID=3021977 RepID=A0ABT6BFF7_9GAMM|nr:lipocalin family protein [Luteibacter sp. PPL193]MDY1549103.1 lipocalin family protein [Luteibacter sp. PPL193]